MFLASVNVNSLYAVRLGLQQQKEVTNVFDCLQLKIVANAAFRVKKYATAFFYYELALSYQCFGFVMNSEEANLRDRDNGNVQNLIESALCLSDADLAYAFPTFSNILDLFDSKHVHKLYDFTEESSQFEQNLRNLDQLLIATEKFPDQYDSQLKQNALYKIQSILIKSGLHYLADCVKGKGSFLLNLS